MANSYKYTTPSEAWEYLIGSQSVKEFMNKSSTRSITIAVRNYIAQFPSIFPDSEFTQEEIDTIQNLLEQEIEETYLKGK